MKRERSSAHINSKNMGKGEKRDLGRKQRTQKRTEVQQNVPFKTKLIWLFAILAVTLIAYYPSFDNEITSWDDEFYINTNPYLELSKENVSELFKFETYYMGNYHPLSMVSLSIDHMIGGLDEEGNIKPFMFHFTNIILHLLVSLFVFWFVFALIKNFNAAVIAGLIFGVHTLHVESVAWISERKDVLYAFFFVAALISYIKYIDSKKVYLYILALIFFLLSLFSKGQAVSLAVTVIIIDIFRRRKLTDIKVILEKIPFLALAVFFGMIAIGAQKESEALVDEQAYSFVQRLGIGAYAFMQYVFKLIMPVNLAAIYPYPDIQGQTIPAMYYFMLLPVLFIAILFFRFVRKGKDILAFGIAFFVANIFLLLQFIPVGSAVHADRYAYIPSIGFIIILAVLIFNLTKQKPKSQIMIYTGTGAYIAVLMVLSIMRSDIWQDTETLWTDTVAKSPKSVVAWNNLGSFKDKKAVEAMENFLYNEAKEFRYEAIKDFTKAIEGKPDYKNAFYNRGISRYELGKMLNDTNLLTFSIGDFNKALEQDAQFADAYHNRGNAKAELGNFEAAIKDFDLAIALNPDEANYYANRGVTKGKMRDLQGAIDDFNLSLTLKPDDSAVYSNRGRAKMLGNDLQGAIDDYNKSIELDPKHHTAYFNRAIAKQRMNDISGALEDFSSTISLNPEMIDAYYFRGLILIDLKKTSEACQDLKVAADSGIPSAKILVEQYCK